MNLSILVLFAVCPGQRCEAGPAPKPGTATRASIGGTGNPDGPKVVPLPLPRNAHAGKDHKNGTSGHRRKVRIGLALFAAS